MTILRTAVTVMLRVYDASQEESRLLPVTAVTASFAVNEIPTCQVQVGLGYLLRRSSQVSVIDASTRRFLQEDNMAQVLIGLEGEFKDGVEWDERATVLFEGKIKNVADQITRGAAALNVSMKSWVNDLQGDSLLYQYANVNDWRIPKDDPAANYGAAFSQVEGAAGPGGPPAGAIGQLIDAASLSANNVAQDIWGKGIKELMAKLASNPLANVLSGSTCGEAVNRVPEKVKAAIERIQGPTSVLGRPYSSGAVPLRMAESGVDPNGQPIGFDTLINDAVAVAIAHEPIDTFRNSDAWTKIINLYCPLFGCAFVPRVQDAMFVPYMPALRDAYCTRITANEIVQLDTLEPISKPVKAIGVISGTRDMFNSSEAMSLEDVYAISACFSPSDNPRNNGRVDVIPPPAWLRRLATFQDAATVALTEQVLAGGTVAPGQPLPPVDESKIDGIAGILRRYAKMVYYERRISGKSLKIVGKLRFDIAPGSVIRVSATPDQFQGMGQIATEFQGYVNRVTVVIDVTRRAANTIFQLSHNRTIEDNALDSFTTDRHPMFSEQFYGAPLIDQYDPSPCQTYDAN